MLMNKLEDSKAIEVREKISTQNLILILTAKYCHWFTYLLIRSSEKYFMLILLDSLYTDKRSNFNNIVAKWFGSSKDEKERFL